MNAGTMIASTDNGTYRTTNGGATWTLQTTVGYMTLARSPANPSIIYGSTGSPIYQSLDNGVTWSFKGSLPACCANGIIADPINANTAYAYGSSTFRSAEDCEQWHKLESRNYWPSREPKYRQDGCGLGRQPLWCARGAL